MIHIILLSLMLQGQSLPTINSTIDKSSDFYETSINGYKSNEFWENWAVPISNLYNSSSVKNSAKRINYIMKNIQDYDLNTAWVPQISTKAYFEYKFNFPDNNTYASAYQFQGICDLFNGYCKSLADWKANSRVKKFLVYFNNKPLCYVNILDTWHFQFFDVSTFFKNRREKKNLHAAIEIKNGDKIRFEIVEIYPGEKYKDVAISEFLCEGAGN